MEQYIYEIEAVGTIDYDVGTLYTSLYRTEKAAKTSLYELMLSDAEDAKRAETCVFYHNDCSYTLRRYTWKGDEAEPDAAYLPYVGLWDDSKNEGLSEDFKQDIRMGEDFADKTPDEQIEILNSILDKVEKES